MALTGLLSLLGSQEWMQRHLRNLAAAAARPSLTVQPDHQPVYLATLWHHAQRPVVAIAPRLEDARRLHDQLLTYLGEDAPVYLLPESEVLPFERLAVDARTINQRLAALAALAAYDTGDDEPSPPLVVASVSAACRLTLPPRLVAGRHPDIEHSNRLSVGARIHSLDNLLAAWVQLGYRHEPQVDTPGSFSLRGGILDVFPPDAELPYRIELWDDEVDTIRRFDPETQRSIEPADEVRVIAAAEQLPDLVDHAAFDERRSVIDLSPCSAASVTRFQEELGNLLVHPNPESLSLYNGLLNDNTLADFLPADALVVFDRPARLAGESEEMEAKFAQQKTNRQNRGELPYGFPSPNTGWDSLLESIQAAGIATVRLERWSGEREDDVVQPVPDTLAGLENFTNDVTDQVGRGNAVVAVSQHASRLVEVLGEAGVKSQLVETLPTRPRGGRVYVMAGGLRKGWQSPASTTGTAVTVFSDAELFGTVKERRYRAPRARRDLGDAISLADLTPGAYVVHIDHGVARFTGTTHLESAGEEREYLVLEYAGDDRLYVPTEQLDRIGAYVSANDYQPTLTRLGGNEWQRIKERARGAAREIAEELLRLYATRESIDGHRFGADAAWQRDLEDAFPYVETPDQLRAINEVKGDMEVSRPMDRLICGDVGYGKTEVALRAAFKTVNEGMQVGLLVPTTVLAQQHYATFTERLSPFPVRVEVLSRFRTPKEQQEVIEGLKSGEVDIVIGTHRLLQKDVQFKNLGLAVVDEEQRFGVAHKEQIKRLRREVDVLTLSATPIPRTLNLALSGIRDLSTMDTPPESRLPIKTFVSEYSDDVVKEAILREMERGGQVFFLHNRVRTIERTAADLAELVPQARILIGHGQMDESDLEDVMVAFSNGEADILVCTTIIESGLDLPNVNTLILDRADRFGLSQLYQLRGRIGRGEHRGYAYMLVPRGRRITEAAQRRLQAILEISELGAGFRIAMRDLEIRGAGNLLGTAQSGHIREVGLDLYSQLLQEAISELRHDGVGAPQLGQVIIELPRIELPLQARIPETYIEHMPSRLAVYQRIAKLADRKQVPVIKQELRDRFGPFGEEVENLLVIADLRALAAGLGIESILHASDAFVIQLRVPVGGARIALQRALGSSVSVGNQQLRLPTRQMGDQWLTRLTRTLERFRLFQEKVLSGAG
jgi:transcription-repair coupling factor (superfamily II helicase)